MGISAHGVMLWSGMSESSVWPHSIQSDMESGPPAKRLKTK